MYTQASCALSPCTLKLFWWFFLVSLFNPTFNGVTACLLVCCKYCYPYINPTKPLLNPYYIPMVSLQLGCMLMSSRWKNFSGRLGDCLRTAQHLSSAGSTSASMVSLLLYRYVGSCFPRIYKQGDTYYLGNSLENFRFR